MSRIAKNHILKDKTKECSYCALYYLNEIKNIFTISSMQIGVQVNFRPQLKEIKIIFLTMKLANFLKI